MVHIKKNLKKTKTKYEKVLQNYVAYVIHVKPET